MSEVDDRVRDDLSAAMNGEGAILKSADRLCHACVDLLGIDGAAISLLHEGSTRGTYGSSGPASRRLDELQFTFGEGPCLDSAAVGVPVLVPDLDDPSELRWPALRGALLREGINAVFALPVTISETTVGALDLFRLRAGPLSDAALSAGLVAADLAALPLLDLMAADLNWDAAADGGSDDREQLAPLERVEVYQATGMIIAALSADPEEALLRLRVYAFTHEMTASEAAWAIVNRSISLDTEDWQS